MEETADSQTGEPAWATLSDAQLLQMRICDLHVRIEGSEIQPRVQELYAELAERNLAIRPVCYLGDEWFSPEGSPTIAIPFYLAYPRLEALELKQMLEVEGGTPEWCMSLLRHECGHAIDHAYGFSARDEWREIFGDRTAEYDPETYRPRPYSRSYVQHLPNWYAQSHPDEDFAETFAVWLAMPADAWRTKYEGWKALEKLEYVEKLMQEAATIRPAVSRGRRISEASKLKRTLERYYAERRRRFAEDFPDFYDADLQAIFGKTGTEPAHKLMRRNKQALINSIVHWTGQPKYTVDQLVTQLIKRSRELGLKTSNDDMRVNFDLAAYLATLVTNYLHTGKFKRLV
jgi:hypothetical protein